MNKLLLALLLMFISFNGYSQITSDTKYVGQDSIQVSMEGVFNYSAYRSISLRHLNELEPTLGEPVYIEAEDRILSYIYRTSMCSYVFVFGDQKAIISVQMKDSLHYTFKNEAESIMTKMILNIANTLLLEYPN